MLIRSLKSYKEQVEKAIKSLRNINYYKRIETGKVEEGKRQMIFACLFTKKAMPYKNYLFVNDQFRNKYIPLVLMNLRWDGCFGFPGGEVDYDENLLTAMRRELIEELNLDIDILNDLNLKPLTTFASKEMNIHSFFCEIEEETLKYIAKNTFAAEHYLSENVGSVLIQIADFNGKGYPEFLKNRFSGTAKRELKELVKVMELLKS